MLVMVSSFKWISAHCSGHNTASDLFPCPCLDLLPLQRYSLPCAVSISYYSWAVALEFSMRRAAPDRCLTRVMLLMIPNGTLPYSSSRMSRWKTKRNSMHFTVKHNEDKKFLHIGIFYLDLVRNDQFGFFFKELTKMSSYIFSFAVYLEHLSKLSHLYVALKKSSKCCFRNIYELYTRFLHKNARYALENCA